jgi:hypothetical protein
MRNGAQLDNLLIKSPTHADELNMSWNEKADIQFLKWQPLYESEKPFQLFLDIPPEAPDERRTNLVFETRTVPIRNIRGEESRFSLDNNGFVYRKFEGFKNLDSKDEVLNEYLPAVQRLLEREVEGAHKVLIFDWRVSVLVIGAVYSRDSRFLDARE